MYLVLRVLMVLHIIGIVIMAGTTMIDYLTFKTFWKLADQGDARSVSLIPLMAKYGAFIRTGGIIIILTGIAMLGLEKGGSLNQFWFKVKLFLVFLLLLNGIFVGNTQGHKFRDAVTANASDFMQHTMHIRESLNRFYPIQLTLFFLIVSISMIRFDKIPVNINCIETNS